MGARGRHEHAIAGAQVMDARHERGLVREGRLGVQHALRCAARSRGEQHRGQLLRFGPGRSDRFALGQRVEVLDDQPRRDRGACALDVVRAELMVQRCGDRAQPPARAVQHRDLVAIGRLPRDGIARGDAALAQTAGDARDV